MKATKSYLILIIIVLIATIATIYYINHSTNISIESNDHIDITPQEITDIKKIGQWEFLCVCTEEVVDTIRKNMILADDRLVRIYNGKLRLGIDLGIASDDWVKMQGDTAIITLPTPGLLDTRFIDEATTVTFYERGYWDASAKEAMYHRAKAKMMDYALTSKNLKTCRETARNRFENLFLALGASHAEVTFVDELPQ